MRIVVLLALSAFTTSLSAFPATDPWDGTWKLDFEHSQITGDTFSYSKTADGMWHIKSGGAINITFATDGKPYRSFSDHDTVTAYIDGERAWTFKRQHDGEQWEVLHEEISSDGKTLTDRDTTDGRDGTKSEVVTIYERVEGDPKLGFVGKWESVKMTGNHSNSGVFVNTYVMSSTGLDTMRWVLPNEGLTIEGKVDGSPLHPKGSEEVFVQITRISEKEFHVDVNRDGKVERTNRMTLSPDARTSSLISWDPDKPEETKTGIYLKQP